MKIDGATALVTGANRGLGRALALELVERKAVRVYAGARNPATVTDSRLIPVRLDVTDHQSIADAAQLAHDVDLVVNNAGILIRGSALTGAFDDVRAMFETNVFGALEVTRQFAPLLEQNGGGALVNIMSVRTWATTPGGAAYGATKAALWSLTNAFRTELDAQGTLVVGVHVGVLDTEAQAGIQGPKLDPADLAAQVLDAVSRNETEVLGDRRTRVIKTLLSGPPEGLSRPD